MQNKRTIEAALDARAEAAARFAIEMNSRSIDLVVGYLNEASVLVLVFGILDTYANGKLSWTVAVVVVGLAFALFAVAMSTRLILYRVARIILRSSLKAVMEAEEGSSQWR
jgi:hypothetical protein